MAGGRRERLCVPPPCPSEDLLWGPLPASLGPSRGELVGVEEQGACATPGPAHPRQSPGYQELSNWGLWIGNRKVYLTRSKLVWTRPEPPPLHPVPSAPVSTARVCFWEVSPFSFLPQMRASIRPISDPGKGPRRLEKSSCEEMGSWVLVEGVGVGVGV